MTFKNKIRLIFAEQNNLYLKIMADFENNKYFKFIELRNNF